MLFIMMLILLPSSVLFVTNRNDGDVNEATNKITGSNEIQAKTENYFRLTWVY